MRLINLTVQYDVVFQGLKRKWEGVTGVPVPKKLRTSSESDGASNQSALAELGQKPDATAMTAKKTKVVTKMPPLPPHPDDDVDVDSMIVNDLRKELKKRKLGTSGRKAELQARLREHLAEARRKREEEWAAKHAVKEAESQIKKQVRIGDEEKVVHKKCSGSVEEMDVVMEDANEEEEEDEPMESEPVAKPTIAAPAKVSVTNNQASVMMKQPPKSALKPSKYAPAGKGLGTPQLDNAKRAAKKPAPSSLAKEDPRAAAAKQLVPTKVSDSSTESSSVHNSAFKSSSTTLQPSVQKTKISSTLAQTTPAFKKTSAGGAGSASGKLLEKKKAHAAATEARKARMAEMRQKAKPTVASASSATKMPSSHSKYAVSSTLKKMGSSSTLGESSKSNAILAKMREKAAAEKSTNSASVAAAPPATKPKEAVKQHSSNTSSSTGVKRGSQVIMSQPGALKSTALKSILDPANKPSPVVEEAVKPESPMPEEKKPLSPMQTYEMSDREAESDSDSESDDDGYVQRPKKAVSRDCVSEEVYSSFSYMFHSLNLDSSFCPQVPEWAQKANLHRALERQFADGPDRIDPDKLFGEVLTCNLDAIFDKKKSRYQRRTSSGNWTKDHVTIAEKLTYKRTMGYAKK